MGVCVRGRARAARARVQAEGLDGWVGMEISDYIYTYIYIYNYIYIYIYMSDNNNGNNNTTFG